MFCRILILILVGMVTVACDTQPQCKSGEFRLRGKLPPRLFPFETTCRADCFTSTVDESCNEECGEFAVGELHGSLWGVADDDDIASQIVDDRMLTLVDTGSLSDGRAIVWEFGYVDMANGQAPPGWGFMRAGPRTYTADEWDSTAQFVVRVGIAIDVNGDGIYSLNPNDGEVAAAGSEVIYSTPGRLEILKIDTDEGSGTGQIAGRLFLAFETPTLQPQSEIIGCFDLSVGPSTNDGEYRRQVFP